MFRIFRSQAFENWNGKLSRRIKCSRSEALQANTFTWLSEALIRNDFTSMHLRRSTLSRSEQWEVFANLRFSFSQVTPVISNLGSVFSLILNSERWRSEVDNVKNSNRCSSQRSINLSSAHENPKSTKYLTPSIHDSLHPKTDLDPIPG